MAQAKVSWDDATIDEVTEAVRGAARVLDAVSEQALAESGGGLTVPQLHMLTVLNERGPSSVAALATELEVNRSTALRMVERLVAAGTVSRTDNPANGREVVVKPTRTGTALIRKVATRRRKALVKVFGAAGVEADKRALKVLRALADAS